MKMRLAWLSFLTLALAACGSSSPAKGSLTVNVTGLPGGTAGAVLVTGPGGYSTTVTATGTLSGLAVGSYTVAPQDAVVAALIVGELYQGTVDQASPAVTANATATVNVTYARRPGTGRLWLPAKAPALDGYAAAQLAASGTPAPGVAVTTAASGTPEGVAFDHEGNAWVTDLLKNTLSGYAAADLASSGTPTPAVVLSATSGSLANPTGLAFDGQGNLWVANYGGNTLVGYGHAQLGSSGSPAPQVILSGFSAPTGLAFDHGGNLWVANSGNGTVAELTPAQLAATGTPTPAVELSGSGIGRPFGLAFDTAGNLWVGTESAAKVTKFTPAQLAATGTPTPDVTLSISASLPTQVAFDHGGNLWVADAGTYKLYQFPPASLATSGSPTPQVTITTGVFDAALFAFDPPAPGTPIYR